MTSLLKVTVCSRNPPLTCKTEIQAEQKHCCHLANISHDAPPLKVGYHTESVGANMSLTSLALHSNLVALYYGGPKVQFLFSAPLFLFSAPPFLFSAPPFLFSAPLFSLLRTRRHYSQCCVVKGTGVGWGVFGRSSHRLA